MKIDKVVLKFIADVLYLKGVIFFEELEAIMECRDCNDLDEVFERMMKEDFNAYRRGTFTDYE